MIYKKIKIIIPSYNCTNKLISVIRELHRHNIRSKIYIVDDNSSVRSKLIINFIKNQFSNISFVSNNKNLGQGGSIKRAIHDITETNCLICTIDDDGQHDIKDVKKIISKANKVFFSNSIILGSRNLDFYKTPLNSFIGNKLSNFVFFCITKKKIKDSQTGLRFYSQSIANKFLKIKANGFDFHNLMNYFLIKKKINYFEFEIETIYFDKNKKTRFKGIKDTLKIINQIINNI